MDRIVRKKLDNQGQEKVVTICEVDWTMLPDDLVTQLFSCLNNRDRASLSSTCKTWWILRKSPFLWQTLDLRHNKRDADATKSLASRCNNLQKLRFRGVGDGAASVMNLKASHLREISIEFDWDITDATLSALVARHEMLENLMIKFCLRISSSAIEVIALCCPNLKKLRLSNVKYVNGKAIHALADSCQSLTDIGFIECEKVDEAALGNVRTLRFLSVAGTTDINWNLALVHWSNLSNLVCLDVSMTDIEPSAVSELLLSCSSLKVLCALDCPSLEHNSTSINCRGKRLVALFTDISKELTTLFTDVPKEKGNVFLDRRYLNSIKDRKLEGVLDWLEWNLCNSLLFYLEKCIITGHHDDFWLHQGMVWFLSFLQSPHEEVQERAVATLAIFDDERTKIFIQQGGVRFLVNLARSWQEGLQFDSVHSIAVLSSGNNNFVKILVDEGVVDVLISIVKSSSCQRVAAFTLLGLLNISVDDESMNAVAEAGGVQTLVDAIVKWSKSDDNEDILNNAADALANLAVDEKCTMEVAWVGVAPALAKLLKTGMAQVVQKQVHIVNMNSKSQHAVWQTWLCITNSHGYNSTVRVEKGALEGLVQLVHSSNDSVRVEAARALLNLSSIDERNREEIAAVGGVHALVALANSRVNASHKVHRMAAGALWRLSVSEENSIAIGQAGGVTALIALASSDVEEIHEFAAGALWELACNTGNAIRIIEDGGVLTLIHLCSSSTSKMARLVSVLALAYMFDMRLDELAMAGMSSKRTPKSARLESARSAASTAIKALLDSYSDPHAFSAAASSSSPASEAQARATKLAGIRDANILKCSGSHIERFLTMLGHSSSVLLKSCAAFALLQFTKSGDKYTPHHVDLLKKADGQRVLRRIAASSSRHPEGEGEAKAFARAVLKNLDHHNVDDFN